MPRWVVVSSLILGTAAIGLGIPPEAAKEKSAVPSPEADQAANRAQVEKGLRVQTWAAEPLLANPVAFAFDEHGRCFVAETFRMHDGVIDTRSYMHMLDDDIGSRTIADRLKKYQTHKLKDYSGFSEQLRIIWDSKGAGKADASAVFAGGFNKTEDGLAAGVLARKGTVYFTCIPDLYAFTTTPDSAKPTEKKSLATGFGIRDQFVGHDLHGLRMGPDGKLYFSIGDRGLNVVNREGKRLFNPDSGAVLRCDPDGANLEIVHIGLRNPQELAFDDQGNLFTYDNNSDSGDQARWVQIVEGGDSGWRCGYQYGTLMHHSGVPQGNRGPWNTEKVWHVPGPEGGTPAYVVPPLLHFGNGPSGITHYPGIGLNDRYRDHFFACDFTANPGNSVIWSLAVKPKGATYEVVDRHQFVRNVVPTDCEFGPDGAFYWSDWTQGWNKPEKGRIFKLTDPEAMKNPAVKEAQELIASGLASKSIAELGTLLGHPHQQVRQEAQYEIATRPAAEAIKVLTETAAGKLPLARLHAVWALGQLARKSDEARTALWKETGNNDPEARAQAARMLGMVGVRIDELDRLITLLQDSNARVRFQALLAIGHPLKSAPDTWSPTNLLGTGETAIRKILTENADQDAYIRHAAVVAWANLAKTFTKNGTVTVTANDPPAVRLGAVLALRRLHSAKVADFLTDADPKIASEAARAIYDEAIEAAWLSLAELADKPGLPDPVAYRALAANYKIGTTEAAARVARVAARTTDPDYLRETALKLLADWVKPSRRDPLTGLTQSIPERPVATVAEAVRPVLQKLFVGSDAVRKEAVQVTAKLGIKDVGPLMAKLAGDDTQPAGVRVEAILALEAVKAKELNAVVATALESKVPAVRAAARVVKAKADPTAAARELPALLEKPEATLIEKQMALAALGEMKESVDVDTSLAGWLDRYLAGGVPPEMKLDVLEAAQARANAKNLKLHAPLREKLKAIDQAARADVAKDPLARFRESVAGGDADRGRAIFLNNAAVYCQRCHKLDGQGGEVGPPLNGIAAKHPRDYLLEAIVNPSAKIAEGYQSVILNTVDGKTISGVLKVKTPKGYTIVTADNKVIEVPKDDVESEKPDKSAMPEDLIKKLSKRELRDIVEFLASLKDEPKK